MERQRSCAFTGHRENKLPWRDNESDPRCRELKDKLSDAVHALYAAGIRHFLCGMATGCDTYFAEAVLELGLRLEAYLPCPSQPDRWSEGDQRRYTAILCRCDAVYMVEPEYSQGCMLRRNRKMVDAADGLLTVYDGSPGGTGAAIDYARRQGKTVTGLWL